MELFFYDIFKIITVFLFLFVSIFLFTNRRGNKVSNKLLGLFLFSKALCYINGLAFLFKEQFISFSPHLFYVGGSFEFILGPSLFFYAKSLAYKDFRLKKTDILHLIPFGIHFLFYSLKFHFYSAETKILLLDEPILTNSAYILILSIIYIHFLIYSVSTVIVISKYNSELKNLYSKIDKIRLTWLQILVTGFIILWCASAIDFIFEINGIILFSDRRSISIVLLFLFANLIVYKGLKHPEIFSGIVKKKKNEKSPISDSVRLDYSKKLDEIMENEKPYLNPDLNLKELSDLTSIPVRHLSYVINRTFHKNFYDYINQYRINESKDLLSNNGDKTVLEILYSTGFNSKSVFNAAFKKHVGMTPSQFKKSN